MPTDWSGKQIMQKNQYIFIILMFFTLAYMLPLGARPLMQPDELRYAEIPREMVASGDWVVPTLNGLKYFEKPVMGYWLHALSQVALGESNFSVRLPSALATGLVALLIFSMLATVLGRLDSRVYLAPLIFLSSFGIFSIGTITILDNVLNFFLTASIVLFFLASEKQSRSSAEKALLLLAGLSVGCAFLTKGFLAFVVPVITVVPYLLWQRRGKEIIRMLWLPGIATVVISLPWSIMIHFRDLDFWNFFFWHEHVRRFFSDTAQHQAPFWFYFVAIIPMFLPWIFLLPSAFTGLFSDKNRGQTMSRVITFSVCWLVFPFLFFSLSSGKIVTYILPCFPPLAILTATGLFSSLRGANRFFSLGLSIFIFLTTFCFFAIIGSQILSFDIVSLPETIWQYSDESLRYSEDLWKPVFIGIALIFMVSSCFWALRCKTGDKKIVLVALSPLVLMISSFFVLPDLTLTVKAPGALLEKEAKNIPAGAIVLADSETVAAACWYLKRNDLFLIQWGAELDYGLARAESKHRVLYYDAIRRLIETRQEKKIVLILRTYRWQRDFQKFPKPSSFITTGKYGYSVVKY